MKIPVVLLLVLLPLGVVAAIDCPNAESEQEVNNCLDKTLTTAEADLSLAYQKALASLGDANAAREALIDAQQKWESFRRSDCDAAWAVNRGGSIRDAVFLSCMIQRSRHRAGELRHFGEPGSYWR